MTLLTKLFITSAITSLIAGCAQTAIQPPVAEPVAVKKAEVERWAWQPIATDDLHFLLPEGFAEKASFVNTRPNTYEVGYYRLGETTQNWTEAVRLVGYRGFPPGTTTPAQQVLKNIATQIRESCPAGFIYEERPSIIPTRVSAVMGCMSLPLDVKRSVFGYYLTVQGKENIYMFIHESRQDALPNKAALPMDMLATWQTQIDRSLICRRGGECAIKVPQNFDSDQFLKSTVPVPPENESPVK